jgi:hypothetical protein
VLGDGGNFKSWGPMGGLQVVRGVSLKETMAPTSSSLFFLSIL